MTHTLINIHTHREEPSGIIRIRSYLLGEDAATPVPPYCAAIHPWSAEGMSTHQTERLLSILRSDDNIVAIGETGLDYAKQIDRKCQQQLFETQLSIAQQRRLPVIIHCVKALDPILAILTQYDLKAVIFHGFVGNRLQATQIINKGYYISIGERSLQSPKTIDAMRTIPLDRLFMETDASEISIQAIYDRVASILGMSVDIISETITKNYKQIFE